MSIHFAVTGMRNTNDDYKRDYKIHKVIQYLKVIKGTDFKRNGFIYFRLSRNLTMNVAATISPKGYSFEHLELQPNKF